MREGGTVVRGEAWTAWPVSWNAILIGALASVVAVVLFGLVGTAIGAARAGAEGRITAWSGIGIGALAYAIFASFLAFVIGGWIAARIGAFRRAEPAMLHGAVAFLVATVVLLAMASFGGTVYNGWYASLAPSPVVPSTPGAPADPNAAKAAAAGATAAAAALLLGLIGSVIGGWAASGEPMNFTYYRRRDVSGRQVASDRTTRI